MGTVDKMIRIILSVIFVILITTGVIKGIGAIVLGLLSFFLIFTGIF